MNKTSAGWELNSSGHSVGARCQLVHFWYKDTNGGARFFILCTPIHSFSGLRNKTRLTFCVPSCHISTVSAIFAHHEGGKAIISSHKKIFFRLSARSKLKSRVPGRYKCTQSECSTIQRCKRYLQLKIDPDPRSRPSGRVVR